MGFLIEDGISDDLTYIAAGKTKTELFPPPTVQSSFVQEDRSREPAPLVAVDIPIFKSTFTTRFLF